MIIKHGEAQPIKTCLDGDEQLICEKCQKPKVIIRLNQDGQDLVCDCEVENQGE